MSDGNRAVEGRFDRYELGTKLPFLVGRAELFELVDRPRLLYKAFGRPRRGKGEMERLQTLAEEGQALFGEEDRPADTHYIAWPRDFVPDGKSAARGVVIPRAEDRYLAPGQHSKLISRGLDFMRKPREVVSAQVRLTLMRQLAEAFEYLDERNLVHGDISQNNVLWCPPPDPTVLLIDCDGLREPGEPGEGDEGGAHGTRGWQDPREERGEINRPDMYSDWYALALAIWRTAAVEKFRPRRVDDEIVLPEQFPLRLGELLRCALEDDRDFESRPRPGEWAAALRAVSESPHQCAELDASIGLAAKAAPPAAKRRARPVADRKPAPTPAPAPVPTATPPPKTPSRRSERPKPSRKSPRKRRRRPRPRSLVLLAVAVVPAFVALLAIGLLSGGHEATAQTRAEHSVARWARSQLGAGIYAACPEGSSLHAGARYTCKVESHSGAVADVEVSVGAGGGIRHRLEIQRFRAQPIIAVLRRHYKGRASHGGPALRSVSCPESIRAEVGAAMTCHVAFRDGGEEVATVTLRSAGGDFVWHDRRGGAGYDSILP